MTIALATAVANAARIILIAQIRAFSHCCLLTPPHVLPSQNVALGRQKEILRLVTELNLCTLRDLQQLPMETAGCCRFDNSDSASHYLSRVFRGLPHRTVGWEALPQGTFADIVKSIRFASEVLNHRIPFPDRANLRWWAV